jgi:hypothetical protein
VLIPDGDASVELGVIPVDDPHQEFLEDVVVRLVEAPGAIVVPEALEGRVVIVDNDGTVEFATPSYTASEGAGQAAIVVRRTSNADVNSSVAYAAIAGTATRMTSTSPMASSASRRARPRSVSWTSLTTARSSPQDRPALLAT